MLPRSRHNDENIRVLSEAEGDRCWVFTVVVPSDTAGSHAGTQNIEVALSWQDYEYWSHGQRSPSHVAEVVVRALIQAQPDRTLPDRFDASTARRWVRDFDDLVREEL